MIKIISIIIGLTSTLSFACPPTEKSLYYKKSEFLLSPNPKLSEQSVDLGHIEEAASLVEDIYSDYLKPAGINFEVRLYLDDSRFAAHPQREDSNWYADLYGGLFTNSRVKYITKDYLYIAACHEIGHHLGHTNYYGDAYWWASGEGQSDYYSTLKCLRRVYLETDNNAWIKDIELTKDKFLKKELALAKNKCRAAWLDEDKRLLCIRSSLAASVLIANLSGDRKSYSLGSPSKKVAILTTNDYPENQCRLDTMFNGSMCSISHTVENSSDSPNIGNCSADEPLGMRPKCWYVGL